MGESAAVAESKYTLCQAAATTILTAFAVPQQPAAAAMK